MKKKEKRNKNNNSHLFKLELQQADGDEGFGVISAGVIPPFCSASPLTSKGAWPQQTAGQPHEQKQLGRSKTKMI